MKLNLSYLTKLLVAAMLFSTLGSVPAQAAGCAAADFAAGSGDGQSSGTAFLISNRVELENLNQCLGSSFNSYNFKLTSDIDLGGASSPWTPIGSVSNRFQGTLDGDNHTISGIFADAAVSGLFSYLGSSATIQNLQLSGEVRGQKIGALAGLAHSGLTVSSVSTNVDVVADGGTLASSPGSVAGGLIGRIFGETPGSTNLSIFTNVRVLRSSEKGIIRGKTHFMGGIVGYAGYDESNNYSGYLDIRSSRVEAPILLTETPSGTTYRVGGIGGTLVNTWISESEVVSPIQSFVSSTQNAFVAGIAGQFNFGRITASTFKGSLYASESDYVSGISGSVDTNTGAGKRFTGSLVWFINNYVSGLLAGGGSTDIAGFFGNLNGDTTAVRPTLTSNYSNALIEASSNSNRKLFASQISSGLSGTSNWCLAKENYLADKDSAGTSNFSKKQNGFDYTCTGVDKTAIEMSTLATYTNASWSIGSSVGSFDSSTVWNMCDVPYLTRESSTACNPSIVGFALSSTGSELRLYLSTRATASPQVGPSSVTLTSSNALNLSNPALSSSRRYLSFQIDSQTIPLTSPVFTSFTQETSPNGLYGDVLGGAFSDYSSNLVIRTQQLSGPSAALGAYSASPQIIQVPLQCTGACGDGDTFDYTASITPAGGSPTTISGTANSTSTTLSFTALSPNVAHTIRASVTYNGQTSATVSTTVTTPRPIATISSVAVTETTATLGVGCTNCGAAPDSFTISATPQAGGAAITSNTPVITGLSSETTYSFAVVIAYAGTTSLSVNYQGNPVRTNPYAPTVTLVSPSSGPLTGGAVTITGTNFSTSSEVRIGTTTVSFNVVNATTITFTAPSSTAGAKDIRVTNQAGAGTLPSAYTYVAGPNLTSISPAVATVNGGTIVTLTGTDLSTATQVNLGNTTISVTVVSNTKVRFVTPATSAGTVDVGIKTTGGVATLSAALEFTSSALVPVITSITPTSGTTAGGTTITVTGQHFSGSYSDSVSAAIDGISGSSVVVVDDSTITFVTPAHAAATSLDVTVLVGGELGTLVGAFSYTAPASNNSSGGSNSVTYTGPEIIDFSIRIIYADGGKVTITGKRLGSISSMKLGGVSVALIDNTDTSATFETSDLPIGVWDLYLANAYGQLTFQQAIQVVSPQFSNTGELLGYKWTLKFIGNSRLLNVDQVSALKTVAKKYGNAETVVCWGYTTAAQPNLWAITHATSRAEAACSLIAKQLGVKTVVRLRYGVEKSWAMRAALQFWKQEN